MLCICVLRMEKVWMCMCENINEMDTVKIKLLDWHVVTNAVRDALGPSSCTAALIGDCLCS